MYLRTVRPFDRWLQLYGTPLMLWIKQCQSIIIIIREKTTPSRISSTDPQIHHIIRFDRTPFASAVEQITIVWNYIQPVVATETRINVVFRYAECYDRSACCVERECVITDRGCYAWITRWLRWWCWQRPRGLRKGRLRCSGRRLFFHNLRLLRIEKKERKIEAFHWLASESGVKLRLLDARTLKGIRKTLILVKSKSASQRLVGMRRTFEDPCEWVIIITIKNRDAWSHSNVHLWFFPCFYLFLAEIPKCW